MYEFIGKVLVGVILVLILLNYTSLGGWSFAFFFAPFFVGGD